MRRQRGTPAVASKVYAEAQRIAWEDRLDVAFALDLMLLVEQEKSPLAPALGSDERQGDSAADATVVRPR